MQPPVHASPAPGTTPTPAAEAPVAPPAEPSGAAGGSTESHDGDEATVKGDSVQEGDGMDQLTDQSLKRQLDDSQDSFIPPNRPLSRLRMVSENELELSNSIAPIYSVDDIMSPRPSGKLHRETSWKCISDYDLSMLIWIYYDLVRTTRNWLWTEILAPQAINLYFIACFFIIHMCKVFIFSTCILPSYFELLSPKVHTHAFFNDFLLTSHHDFFPFYLPAYF